MKNFDDFIESLSIDDYNTIQFSAEQSMNVAGLQDSNAQAYFVALQLLEYYHNWVNKDTD